MTGDRHTQCAHKSYQIEEQKTNSLVNKWVNYLSRYFLTEEIQMIIKCVKEYPIPSAVRET